MSGWLEMRHAHTGTVAEHHVVHAGRHARGIHDLGEDLARVRRNFGRLQDHRAAGGQRRVDLARDLVDRPVPRRDQTADPDRLLHHAASCRAVPRSRSSSARRWPSGGGPCPCRPAVPRPATAAHPSPRSPRRRGRRCASEYSARIACSRSSGSSRLLCDQVANARRAALTALSTSAAEPDRDPAGHLLGGRVVDVQRVRLDRIDPLAVDVELQIFAHHLHLPLTACLLHTTF